MQPDGHELMDRKYIDDQHVVARYLADQLSDTERAAFEAYYLQHPDMLRDMEAAARLKVGLMQLRDSGQLQAVIQARPNYQRQRLFAAAAGIAIAVIGLLLWTNRGPSKSPVLVASSSVLTDRLGRVLRVASLHTIVRTRGVTYDAEITLPDTPQTIALRVLPEIAAQPPRYRITLSSVASDNSLHEIATIGNLSADTEGFVPVYLNSFKLKRGRYRLVLSGEAGTNTASATSAFLIRITDGAS
jgi:hypothetical protein